MTEISRIAARENLTASEDNVREDHSPVAIMSQQDDEVLDETAYLLRSPCNAKRLISAITQLEEGKGAVRDIDADA